jgi:hypothetical protein
MTWNLYPFLLFESRLQVFFNLGDSCGLGSFAEFPPADKNTKILFIL